ncbi:MAG: leucine-rich repeat domain-containing protein [Candidatus Thorarchaeota archaeon]
MSIRFKILQRDGKEIQKTFPNKTQEIFLANEGIQVLEIICDSTNVTLKRINLQNNYLRSIDLTPLANFQSLELLNLSKNKLDMVDLNPIKKCRGLKALVLSQNPIRFIDLTPLGNLTKLEEINLHGNQLQSVDLSPIYATDLLKFLTLHKNRVESENDEDEKYSLTMKCLDITPIHACKKLTGLMIDDEVMKYSFLSKGQMHEHPFLESAVGEFIFDVPCPIPNLLGIKYLLDILKKDGHEWKLMHLLQEFVALVGLGWLGFLDADPYDFLSSILNYEDDEDFYSIARNQILVEYAKQIDSPGTTFGLDLEKAKKESGEISRRIDDIVEIRKNEIQNLQIPMQSDDKGTDYLNLRNLWLTVYGFRILSSLPNNHEFQYRLEPNHRPNLEKAFQDIGFALHTTKDPNPPFPITMSQAMREYILYRLEFDWRFKLPWSDPQKIPFELPNYKHLRT